MERSRRSRQTRRSGPGNGPDAGAAVESPGLGTPAPGTTGKYLVLLREGEVRAGVKALSDTVGIQAASTADFAEGAVDAQTLESAEALVFDKLAVAVVGLSPDRVQALSAATACDGAILAIEPERMVYALQAEQLGNAGIPRANPVAPGAGLPVEYLRGYRDAVNHLVDQILSDAGLVNGVTEEALGESELTWGLQVTKAAASRFSGKGIGVAVLDTGLDLGHPDFVGRQIGTKSFVPNQEVQDGHGHGTHCIGTACGPRQPSHLPRYGIAYEAEIFAGKVLSNQGSGADGGILAGINWAITNRCHVISMSLGAPVVPGQGFSRIFEQVARRGLAAGTLIIAAAGNESERPGFISPVGHPANCPSIMAVAALDAQLRIAPFSSGGLNPQGGQVDIAGPGVRVRSTWPRPALYNTISGTSMATPHVAGIIALLAEANRETRGRALASLLVQSARRLTLPARDVGAGLVQAP